MTSEREVQNAIMRATARLVRVWRNNAGRFFHVANPCPACKLRGRWIQGAPTGSPDLLGLDPTGRFVGIECKTDTGRQTDEQRDFQVMVEKHNGIYIVARSADEAINQLQNPA